MNRRNVVWLIGVISAASLIAGWSSWGAEPRRAATARLTADDSQASSSDKPEDLEAMLRRLDLQSAELSLRLYELDLQKIGDINKQMAGLYSNSVVDRFKANVEMAKQRVKAAQERVDGKRAVAIIGVGQSLLQNAEEAYARDMAANRQFSTP